MWKWLCSNFLRYCPGTCQEGLRNTVMYVRIVSVLAGWSSPEYVWSSFIAILLCKAVIVCNIMFILIDNGCLLIKHWAVDHHKLIFIYRAFLESTRNLETLFTIWKQTLHDPSVLMHQWDILYKGINRWPNWLPGLLVTAWEFTLSCVALPVEKYIEW